VSELDVAILALALLMGVLGFFQGFIVSALSLGGLALGGFAATRIAQQLLDDGSSSPYAPLIGLVGAVLLAAIGGSAFQDIGLWVRERIHMAQGLAVDRVLGSILSAGVAFGIAWFAAAVMVTVPQMREWRPFVLESSVIQRLNESFPPSGPVLNVLARFDPFPTFDGPKINVGPPNGDIPQDPQVRSAARSVVRVVGEACGFGVTGSGWVATSGFVVTNAHVVAGVPSPQVQGREREELFDAVLVAFDPRHDVAVLHVPGLRAPALPAAAKPKPGTGGAVLGYPENGPFSARPARYSDTRAVKAEDIYGRNRENRRITSFRGDVRHGNSGGPLVDGQGRVVTTVFAATVGGSTKGGYGVPNDVVAQVVAAAKGRVDSGPCTT